MHELPSYLNTIYVNFSQGGNIFDFERVKTGYNLKEYSSNKKGLSLALSSHSWGDFLLSQMILHLLKSFIFSRVGQDEIEKGPSLWHYLQYYLHFSMSYLLLEKLTDTLPPPHVLWLFCYSKCNLSLINSWPTISLVTFGKLLAKL